MGNAAITYTSHPTTSRYTSKPLSSQWYRAAMSSEYEYLEGRWLDSDRGDLFCSFLFLRWTMYATLRQSSSICLFRMDYAHDYGRLSSDRERCTQSVHTHLDIPCRFYELSLLVSSGKTEEAHTWRFQSWCPLRGIGFLSVTEINPPSSQVIAGLDIDRLPIDLSTC